MTLLAVIMVAALSAGMMAKSSVTVKPLALMWGLAAVEYETPVADDITLSIQGMYGDWEFFDSIKIGLYGIGAGTRYYFGNDVTNGWYAGAYVDHVWLNADNSGNEATGTGIILSGRGGYKWTFDNNLVVDLGVGGGIPVSINADSSDNISDSEFALAMGASASIGIGYAF